MDVAVTGSHGLIGTALVRALRERGDTVRRLVRSEPAPGDGPGPFVRWDPQAGTIDRAALEGVDGVVHLAGAGIGDKRWTDARKREILESRTKGTSLLAEALAGLDQKPAVFVSSSAIGYYGDRGDEKLTETAPPGQGFTADVCVAWEAAAQPAAEVGIRVAHPRTGIVLSRAGGALPRLLPLFKLGLGGRLGSGRQWWSWITIDDEVAALLHLLHDDVTGPVNLAAPGTATNADMAKALGRVLRRPAMLPVPAFGPKLVLGRELGTELLFFSQRVVPDRLEASGFRFSFPDLEGGLRHVLKREDQG